MGNCYWILLWDGWGVGLVMINPRLHVEGKDIYGNPMNSFSDDAELGDINILETHDLENQKYYKIIRSRDR